MDSLRGRAAQNHLSARSLFRSQLRVRFFACVFTLLECVLAGCGATQATRPVQTSEQLLAARRASDTRLADDLSAATQGLLRREKGEHDAFAAGHGPQPVVNILIISGGGDWGAFGAGFLKGWRSVPAGPMALPQFDVVTGVSTGALIAPFAFLGDEASVDAVVSLYRNPGDDILKPRGWLSLLRGSSSYAEVPGLERKLNGTLDIGRLQRIAAAGTDGRILAVNLTNIDTQEMKVWNLVTEAQRAVQSGSTQRMQQVLLASSAVPGVFPPRQIDGVLYVDGGLTGNVLIGGPQARADNETLVATWLATYPQLAIPKIRYWIIFNNEMRWPPATVSERMAAVVSAGMTASTRSATINCMRLLLLQADLSRLRYQADIEVRIVSVPNGWVAPKPGTFVPETMNALADMGEKMGADPASWSTSIPTQSELSASGP
jgi:predicted acylesterase/phospholipase RssA